MNGKKTLGMTVAPTFENVDAVRTEVEKLCREMFPGDDARSRIGDVLLAATEIMNNAVEHSGADAMEIDASVEGDGVTFRLSTLSAMFDPTANVSMPVMGEDADLPEGGFGLALIREMMDSVEYEYSGGRNILTMRKKIR